LCTLFRDQEAHVFAVLRAAFRAIQLHGPAVMTATLTAGMPTDEFVRQMQCSVVGTGPVGERG
jgi:hypothetical protein